MEKVEHVQQNCWSINGRRERLGMAGDEDVYSEGGME